MKKILYNRIFPAIMISVILSFDYLYSEPGTHSVINLSPDSSQTQFGPASIAGTETNDTGWEDSGKHFDIPEYMQGEIGDILGEKPAYARIIALMPAVEGPHGSYERVSYFNSEGELIGRKKTKRDIKDGKMIIKTTWEDKDGNIISEKTSTKERIAGTKHGTITYPPEFMDSMQVMEIFGTDPALMITTIEHEPDEYALTVKSFFDSDGALIGTLEIENSGYIDGIPTENTFTWKDPEGNIVQSEVF